VRVCAWLCEDVKTAAKDVARKRKCVFAGGLEEVEGRGWPPFAVAESGDAQAREGATFTCAWT
jgi:hypothetical protein